MPDQTPRPSTPPRGGVATTHATTEEKKPASGLSLPQIMAGALAAATAAILGSFLGVIGTIGGAAAASVISTVGAALYQRSLERTRDAVKSRLVVNQAAGTKVATAVARVAGGGAPQGAAPRNGRPQAPMSQAPMSQAPMSPPYGAPMPGRPGPMPPGAPTQRMPGGPQQLRAGGRTVTTRLDPAGRPMAEDPTRRIPDARTPDGRPTQVVPPLGPDGRPMANPTARMPLGPGGPPSPPGGAPTAYLGGPGPGDDPTRLAPAADEPKRRRFGWKTYATLGGVAASIFAIGILASFAVESATGHPLSGGTSGTSVGAIFGQNTEAPATTESSPTEENGGSEAPTSTTSENGNENGTGEQGTQAPSSTTRAPSTTTPRNGGNPLPSVLPRFNEQGGATGN